MADGKIVCQNPARSSPVPGSVPPPETSPRPQAGLDHADRFGTCGSLRNRQAQARLAPSCGRIIVTTITSLLKHMK
ncbi:hypothetical protein [Neisseria sp. 83E34]|uniref:hypothetical protein n=1 Tax=Neisseria sp. 83E34 TaxID=1692264 RepID=UPI000A93EA34|nr:hypothetical protein [Neisseria sp. 83E34]